MKAVIMAGGFGTRMRPLTCNIPKPMVPVANKPIMAHIVDLLRKHGFPDILSILYYQPEVIEGYFRDGTEFSVKMRYIGAEEDLGTAGSVKNAQIQMPQFFDETFIIISGDVLTDFDLSKAVEFHLKNRSKATIALTRVDNPLPFGVVITDSGHKIVKFLEKPTWGEVFSDTINTGIYILEPSVLEYIPPGSEFDFSKDLFPALMANSEPLFGYVADGYWKDVGDLEAYQDVHKDVLSGKVDIEIPGIRQKTIGKDIWVGSGSHLDKRAKLEGSVVIGGNCSLEAKSLIVNSVIGNNCIIEEDAKVINSVLWDGVKIGRKAQLSGENAVGHGTIIKSNAFIGLKAVISDGCSIGSGSSISSNVKLWPHKAVEDGAVLNSSLIWGERWSKSLFGTYGVTGLAGSEITPEFAAKLGAAYGASLRKGFYVSVSRDNHRASRMIARAMISGVMSTGINLHDLEVTPAPVAKFVIESFKEGGGFHVKRSPFDPDSIDIKFFEPDGMNISTSKEKTIERLFFREDFPRARLDETGTLEFPSRIIEYYRERFLNYIDSEVIRRKRLKVVVDYAYGSASTILPSIFGALDCEVVSLNAFMDEAKLTQTLEERENALKQISNIVVTLKADAGFMLDAGAELLFLVDERGRVLSGDQALSLVSLLTLKSDKSKSAAKRQIAVTITATKAIDEIAKKFRGEVIRTKTNPRSMMEIAKQPDIRFVGSRKGGYIFPEFYPVFDGMMSLVKIMEMMASLEVKLGEELDAIPAYHMVREHVPCPWELKGAIMRNLIETSTSKGMPVELIDGVKVSFGSDWAIIIPDGDRPLFHVNAESDDEKRAKELVNEYMEKIREWQR